MNPNDGYTFLIASDISERDGIGLELYDSSDRLIGEIFRDDLAQEVRFSLTEGVHIPLHVLEASIETAHKNLL